MAIILTVGKGPDMAAREGLADLATRPRLVLTGVVLDGFDPK
jgi:hypothetical protein